MRYPVKNRCHVCHGRGVKVDKDLKKLTCQKCNGSGEPQLITNKKKQSINRPNLKKTDGLELLQRVEAV